MVDKRVDIINSPDFNSVISFDEKFSEPLFLMTAISIRQKTTRVVVFIYF